MGGRTKVSSHEVYQETPLRLLLQDSSLKVIAARPRGYIVFVSSLAHGIFIAIGIMPVYAGGLQVSQKHRVFDVW